MNINARNSERLPNLSMTKEAQTLIAAAARISTEEGVEKEKGAFANGVGEVIQSGEMRNELNLEECEEGIIVIQAQMTSAPGSHFLVFKNTEEGDLSFVGRTFTHSETEGKPTQLEVETAPWEDNERVTLEIREAKNIQGRRNTIKIGPPQESLTVKEGVQALIISNEEDRLTYTNIEKIWHLPTAE